MRALAAYILKGRLQAIVITSLMTFVSLLLPPLAYLLSGVPVSLVSLRRGPLVGAQVIAGSLLVVLLLALLVRIGPQIATAFVLEIWIPLWLCAIVLRKTESHGDLVLMASGFGALYIVVTHMLIDDVTDWWRNNLETGIAQALPEDLAGQYQVVTEQLAPFMNGMLAGSLLVSIVLTILVARWWQSMLFNPGGFKKEFYALHLPRVLLLGVLLGVALILIDEAKPGSIAFELLLLLIFAYFIQGLATIHRVIAAKGLPKVWLVMLYVLLLIPQIGLFVACLGMIDCWFERSVATGPKNNS
jgi:uncharacterized protein YybS (DUF2232 family)